MDPYEDIARQCQTSSSQEQHLRDLIISATHHEEEDDNHLGVCSNEEEREGEPNPSLTPLTPIMIYSPPDTLSGEEDQTQQPPPTVRLNSPETKTSFNDANNVRESEPTQIKAPEMEKDPECWENTPKRCSTPRAKSCAGMDAERLESSVKEACVRERMEGAKSRVDVEFSKEKKGDSSSKIDAIGGVSDENPKKSKAGSSVESEIREKFNDGNAVSVSRVFERLIGSPSVQGNVDRHASSFTKSQQLASENGGEFRKLPHSIQNQSKEKGVVSIGAGESRKLPSSIQSRSKEKDGQEALAVVAKVAIASRERGRTGYVDFLEAAKQAGYTFPRPRWWQPGDDF